MTSVQGKQPLTCALNPVSMEIILIFESFLEKHLEVSEP